MSLAIHMNGNNYRLLQIAIQHFENNISRGAGLHKLWYVLIS